MMTVKEVSNLTGVSIRTLQYYDKIGLLHPAHRTQAGYRLYDDAALERLQQILLFRELEFSLEDIRKIAENIRTTGVNVMEFNAFDTQKIKEYAERAKKEWGETTEYQEFEAKNARRTQKESGSINEQLMGLVAAFGTLQTREPADPAVQAQVKKLRDFITENYYTCTKPILYQLGQMYGAGGEFTENINAAGGEGAAEFAQKAIEIYCQ